MDSLNQTNNQTPNWQKLNFHQVMVLICDTFEMTHPEMMKLRQKIEQVYGTQHEVSVKSLAILAYRRFGGMPKDKALKDILGSTSGKLIKTARKIERELYPEQK